MIGLLLIEGGPDTGGRARVACWMAKAPRPTQFFDLPAFVRRQAGRSKTDPHPCWRRERGAERTKGMPRRSPRTRYAGEEASMARPYAAGDLSVAERSRGPAAFLIPSDRQAHRLGAGGQGVWGRGPRYAEVPAPTSATLVTTSMSVGVSVVASDPCWFLTRDQFRPTATRTARGACVGWSNSGPAWGRVAPHPHQPGWVDVGPLGDLAGDVRCRLGHAPAGAVRLLAGHRQQPSVGQRPSLLAPEPAVAGRHVRVRPAVHLCS